MLFGYQIKANKCFVLANPLGNREKWTEATLAFMDQADLLGYQLVFYRISDAYVMTLHDCGYEFMKVGEEGLIQLDEDQEVAVFWSPDSMELQHLTNQGYTFNLYHEPVSQELYQELERVSNEWLNSQKERNFITGRLERAYIDRSSVGIIRNAEHRIVGFITGKPMVAGVSIAYDLIRLGDEAPEFAREFLLTHFIEKYKQAGYQIMDVGMAPLSNVGETKYSFLNERFVHIFYKYGYQIYEFQDTRKRKERYVTCWEARYFAYPKRSGVTFAFIQLILLITKGKHKGATLVEEAMIEV